ncbi:hypothetical protein PSTT_10714 [Puccinia striiformis]|uniref:Uncharacterized protein n=1 Tax=Puccinia striiformis TaxID=27350 RepID=A0A2S4V3B6_9BASI|nr:hypothetical protein PSTT_10714 [Puccinia striiformis]
MQLPSVLSFITLLVTFAIQAHSHSSPPNDYIMREEINLSKGYLSIYSANGKEAYRYNKKLNFPSPGTTTIQVMDASSKILYELVPSNDECRQNSVYVQYENPSRKDQLPIREFTFESHDSFIINGDSISAIVLVLNNIISLNKILPIEEGDFIRWQEVNLLNSLRSIEVRFFLSLSLHTISSIANSKPRVFTLAWFFFSDQLRGDKWWNTPGGVRTFTLSSMDGGPLVEMVTLLALILNKSDDCIKERHHSTAPS